jgi:hypothetical protein
MKRVLIIYKVFADDEGTKGVHRKMLEQARSLERLGAQVDMINLHSKGIQLDGKLVVLKEMVKSSSRDMFNLFDFYNSLRKLDNIASYDVYYIRYSPLTFHFIAFLKFLKKENPNCKIFIELPTYPFMREYTGLKKLLAQWIGRRHKYLKKYVESIVSTSSHSEIWNIPVVNIKNAIDPESFKLRSGVDVKDAMRFVMVSTFFNWHGTDRFVKGMIAYMSNPAKKYNVYLTLIGEGPELDEVHLMAEDPLVKNNIFFYPPSYGGALNQHFDQADIAVGTLAVDRKGLEECSALKHREYGARGIPFIYAGKDVSFDGKDFILQLPLKEQPVDFMEVEKFFDHIKNNPKDFTPENVRKKVAKDLSWEVQIGFVLD